MPASEVGELARLEPLARAIFGDGDREPGWFERKLWRECVVSEHSVVLTTSADPAERQAWIGYGLLGRPPSLGGVARTAGIGVRVPWRGVGLGRRLVEALRERARRSGADTLCVPASEQSAPFYARCGLRPGETTQTLLAFGEGESQATPAERPEPWDAPCPGPILSAWFREAWERTPPARRHTVRVRDGHDRFDVSMEGSAHVALRWTSADGDVRGPLAWLGATPRGTPALLHELPENAPTLRPLLEQGWNVVQTTTAMCASCIQTR